eukprot:2979111-Pleurochrysis_carterae.AAC.1
MVQEAASPATCAMLKHPPTRSHLYSHVAYRLNRLSRYPLSSHPHVSYCPGHTRAPAAQRSEELEPLQGVTGPASKKHKYKLLHTLALGGGAAVVVVVETAAAAGHARGAAAASSSARSFGVSL